MAWITPIIDRQQSDINNRTNKGYLAYTDLNRIENNTAYVRQLLMQYGYSDGISSIIIKTDWTMTDIIIRVDADRIRNNIIALIDCFNKNLPTIQKIIKDNTFTFNQLNILESDLQQLTVYIDRTVNAFLYCGIEYC